ncbi:alpha/beta fold hydrolase [Streptomyces sp. Ncost-T10-10d]|uniref:alpha/beta fold hydrolase n=1 Tax=Streptomyces sp. Ncost-T10-10d TaxID=1839774 RepID=UPI00081D8A93|nr:alpha/beta hydrolase [Streptomyces sp. Ncost-T10-10d]SCF84895.1 Pimeloyl-ACP methyl ester carboxylesterase [Streptomyces sp. Ncost-T10-10d]
MSPAPPTVVLVHGAFADAAGWLGVIDELQRDGIAVLAVANPLRGLTCDAAYLASVVSQIDGPVVLVGHSYGGALITVAGTADNVVGLVYIAAYAPEEGESLSELQDRFPAPPLVGSLKQWTYPTDGGKTATEVSIAPEAFPSVFAADVSPSVVRLLAASQRPLAASAFTDAASAAAWRTKPCWALVADADQAINPDVERFGARRAGATTVELEGASHAVAVSRPSAVADLIRDAVCATS